MRHYSLFIIALFPPFLILSHVYPVEQTMSQSYEQTI